MKSSRISLDFPAVVTLFSEVMKKQDHIKDATQDALNEKYRDEVGYKARVQRETIENDSLAIQLREVLEDIGRDIQKVGHKIPAGMEYKGSIAVHIYQAPALGMVGYYSQLAIGNCDEALVGPAITDLRGAALQEFGHRRQKKRSGF